MLLYNKIMKYNNEAQLLREQLVKMETQHQERDYTILERDYKIMEIDYKIQQERSDWAMVDFRKYIKLRESKRREMEDNLREMQAKRKEMQDKRIKIMEETMTNIVHVTRVW